MNTFISALKAVILIVVLVAIGICGYMACQEYQEKDVVDDYVPTVVQLNDSTFHINLSEDVCATLMKDADTLNIDVVGKVTMVMTNKDNDTITFVPMYSINYSDYFDSARFDNFNIQFIGK